MHRAFQPNFGSKDLWKLWLLHSQGDHSTRVLFYQPCWRGPFLQSKCFRPRSDRNFPSIRRIKYHRSYTWHFCRTTSFQCYHAILVLLRFSLSRSSHRYRHRSIELRRRRSSFPPNKKSSTCHLGKLPRLLLRRSGELLWTYRVFLSCCFALLWFGCC